MHLELVLKMAAAMSGDRVAFGPLEGGTTMADFAERAGRVGARFAASAGAERVAMVDLNSEAVPLTLFGSVLAAKPFVPINYRLTDDQLRALVARTAPALVVVGEGVAQRIGEIEGIEFLERSELLAIAAGDGEGGGERLDDALDTDPSAIAVLLYTSGTTGDPKAAVLRHLNLGAYVVTTVELGGSSPEEAALVSVPPYHIAGISAAVTSVYGGRRVVYLESFDPVQWVATARREAITHAMVVPTMLGRILDVMEAEGLTLDSLRTLSYGGGPMPAAVIERALSLLPGVDFVNAYGLTETSSTIALLGPDDHRVAFASEDPQVRARLNSVGRTLASVEVSIRDEDGNEVPVGHTGEVWVRGEQVSGEYLGRDGGGDGWFHTRDAGHLDTEGFLFVEGRLDDVIVRGGENLSPGEIAATLLEHDAVAEAAVVGVPDVEWGEKVVAAVVAVPGAEVDAEELREFVRGRLRSTKTPERISVVEELPFNETGKLLRRTLREQLADPQG
ncbi:MAG: AMP-binding protein [Microthrixaceae bacterium]